MGGRVLDRTGAPVSRATVTLMDTDGSLRSTSTNAFGYFHFDDVVVGKTYVISIRAKGHVFRAQSLGINDELTGLDFFEQ